MANYNQDIIGKIQYKSNMPQKALRRRDFCLANSRVPSDVFVEPALEFLLTDLEVHLLLQLQYITCPVFQ